MSGVQDLRAVRSRLSDSLRLAGACDASVFDSELILTELVSNSIKHRHDDSTIDVVLEWDKGEPILHVTDFGPSFDVKAEPRPHHFERGRGLYIVSSLARGFRVDRSKAGENHARALLPV